MSIHPTAIISPEAQIADDVHIGPYSVIRGKVKIGKGCRIDNHATIGCESGVVEIGEDNVIHTGAVVGSPPQDVSYKGECTRLEIGDRNIIREFATLNIGTTKDKGVTKIASDNLLMAYVHIAHDCVIGNHVVIANSTHFAGHVVVGDHVKIGGGCLFSQFIRLGHHAYIAGDSTANKDILPFSIAQGVWAVSRATNKIGMSRSGVSKDEVDNVHKAMRYLLQGDRTIEEAMEKIRTECTMSDNIKYLLDFISSSTRGIAR